MPPEPREGAGGGRVGGDSGLVATEDVVPLLRLGLAVGLDVAEVKVVAGLIDQRHEAELAVVAGTSAEGIAAVLADQREAGLLTGEVVDDFERILDPLPFDFGGAHWFPLASRRSPAGWRQLCVGRRSRSFRFA